ncbi:MAG: peptidoglycan DD-metalloendopeptidase family protein [Actinobacteria bacterium]|nr:peptidoglycan DD-metalloendopeptidase family protein [Actinomycetota bacterium]
MRGSGLRRAHGLGRRSLLAAALAAGGVALARPLLVRSVTEDEIRQAEAEKQRVEQQQRNAEAILSATQTREGTLQRQLAVIDTARYAAVERLRQVQRELETVQLEVLDITSSVDGLNRTLATDTHAIERKVRSLYLVSRQSTLETVVAARSFAEALDRVAALKRVLARDLAGIDALRSGRRAVQLRTADLSIRLDRIDALRAGATAIEAELAKRAEEQKDLVFAAQREGAEVAKDVTAFEAESAAIGWRIAVLREIRVREIAAVEARRRILEQRRLSADLARGLLRSVPVAASGGYVWPLFGRITTYFGGCTFGQCPHLGLDIAAPEGSPVVAASDGVVLAAGLVVPGNRRGSYGMIVVISHSAAEETLYAHLDDLRLPPPVAPGEFVSAGQVIGYVGMTGWTSGPHLHFEYRVKGVPMNPGNVLP